VRPAVGPQWCVGGSVQMGQRVERAEATQGLERLLGKAVAGRGLAGIVVEVWVFGSYLAGASRVGDVDLIVIYDDADSEWQAIQKADLERFERTGRYWEARDRTVQIARALRGNSKIFNIIPVAQSGADGIDRNEAFAIRKLLFERGDTKPVALERLDEITE